LTDIKTLVKSCDYGNQEDKILRDRIVFGQKHYKKLQNKLLEAVQLHGGLDLTKAINMCRIDETTEKNKKVIQEVGEGAVAVDAVRQSFKGGVAANPKEKDHALRYKSQHQDGAKKHVATNFSKPFDCTNCGTKHRVRECPEFQKECSACGRLNHFAKTCRITKYNNQKFSNQKYINSKGEHKRKNIQAKNS
jgi:hypothetical protein